jgi:protein-disulfide isomerase
MEVLRIISSGLMPPKTSVKDLKNEAQRHLSLVNGFKHKAALGCDDKNNMTVITLTFDPSCERCKELVKKMENKNEHTIA